MEQAEHSPRVAVLGAREDETELLADLHRQGRCVLLGLYDPDPASLGLPLAEIMGIPAGSGLADRQRLSEAEYVVLPRDRMALREAIEWCSGLRAQLISLDEARQRWGRIGATPDHRATKPQTEDALVALSDAGERLQSPAKLAEWLLDITMPAIGATGGSIQLLSATGDELYLVAGRGLSENTLHNARRPLGEAVSGLVAATRTPQILHGEHRPHADRDRDAIHSAISLPLELQDGTLTGVLNLSTSVHGQHFQDAHVHLLQQLAPRCALLLQQSQDRLAHQDRELGNRLVALLDLLDNDDRVLRANLLDLCRHIRAELRASTSQLLFCRSDGRWLPLAEGTATEGCQVLPPADELADKILLDGRWRLFTRLRALGENEDALDTRVETALDKDAAAEDRETVVLVPLSGVHPWGLLVATFSTAADAERLLQVGQPFARDLGHILEARMQRQHVLDRINKLSLLAHSLPQLLAALQEDRLPRELLEQTRNMVSAQQVAFRHVDMLHRRYSPPMSIGVQDADFEAWRKRDAHLTEKTLRLHGTHVMTTMAEVPGEGTETTPSIHSMVSLPIEKYGQLIGVLNVYNKVPQESWQDQTFDEFDVDMLESMAVILAELLPQVESNGYSDRGASAENPPTQ